MLCVEWNEGSDLAGWLAPIEQQVGAQVRRSGELRCQWAPLPFVAEAFRDTRYFRFVSGEVLFLEN